MKTAVGAAEPPEHQPTITADTWASGYWYDSGGMLPAGLTYVVNHTGQAIPVYPTTWTNAAVDIREDR